MLFINVDKTLSIISAHFFPITVCRSSSFGWFFSILPGLACSGQFLCIIAQSQHAECHFPKQNWVVNINFGKFSHANKLYSEIWSLTIVTLIQKILTVCSPLFISWLVLLCLRALACCVWKFPEIDVNDPISFWKMTFSMLQLCNNAKKLTRTCKSWQYIKKSSERRWSADSDWKKMSWNYWWCNTAFFRCKVFTL